MNTEPQEPLDELLQSWGEKKAAHASHLRSLRQAIIDKCAESSKNEPLNARRGIAKSRSNTLVCIAWFSLGVAATLLISLTVYWNTHSTGEREVALNKNELPPEFVWLEKEQLQNKAALLSELERLFQNRFQWFVETGGRIELGVAEEITSQTLPNETVAVRLVVAKRKLNAARWQPVWAVDVVARGEQLVQANSRQQGDQFALWAYPLPDGKIALDWQLNLDAPLTIHREFSTLCDAGEPTVVLTEQRNGAEYRVYQTVTLVEAT